MRSAGKIDFDSDSIITTRPSESYAASGGGAGASYANVQPVWSSSTTTS